MPQLKFGRRQLGKPMPQGVALIADFFAGFCGIVAAFLTSAKFIPQPVSDIASPILTGLFIPLSLYIKRFFGAQIESETQIPVDEVSEIRETASDKP